MTLGKRIGQHRKTLGLSQEALGERLGVSRQAVSKWETDAAVPDMENLLALARLFGVSVAELTQTPEDTPLSAPVSDPEPPPAPRKKRRLWWILPLVVLCLLLSLLPAFLAAFVFNNLKETSLSVEVSPVPDAISPSEESVAPSHTTEDAAPSHTNVDAAPPLPAPQTDFALLWYDGDGGETFLELGVQDGLFPFGRDLRLTEPEEIADTDFGSMTDRRADCGGLTVAYYHIDGDAETPEQETVWMLSTIVSDFRTPRGIRVGSTKAQVIDAYGDAPVYCMKEDGYSLVQHDYFYAFQTPETGGCSLQLFMRDGLVAGIRVEHMGEWGSEAFAPDRLSRFPLKDGEPDFSQREQPEQEIVDDTRAVYIAFNQLVTNNNLSAEERYTHRRTVFFKLSSMDWWAFGQMGNTENPDDTIAALLTWLREEAPYSEGEVFRLQMGCLSNLDGWLADTYANVLSSALFADPAAFVNGLAHEGQEECMRLALRLAAYDADAYPVEQADTAAALQDLLDSGRFTDARSAWAELLIRYLNTPMDAWSGLPDVPLSLP